jgi:hypothetical protein
MEQARGKRRMAHLMWVGPHMAINSRAFHLHKHTKSLRAREERFEKEREFFQVFQRRGHEKYKCSIFSKSVQKH